MLSLLTALQMEPAGCINSLLITHWDMSGGNRGSCVPHQPDYYQGYEGSQNCKSSQASQDGQGYQSPFGYCYASFTPGRDDPNMSYDIHFVPR